MFLNKKTRHKKARVTTPGPLTKTLSYEKNLHSQGRSLMNKTNIQPFSAKVK